MTRTIGLTVIIITIAINWIAWEIRKREFAQRPTSTGPYYNTVIEQQLEQALDDNARLREEVRRLRCTQPPVDYESTPEFIAYRHTLEDVRTV